MFSLSIVLFSCKTLPQINKIQALDLLDNKSGFYIALPKNADEDLLKRVMLNNVEGLSEKDIDSILERIDKVYLGLNKSKKNTSVQLTIDGNIPSQFIPKILNKKRGWKSRTFTPADSKNTYHIYNNQNMELAFPSSSIACSGRDIEKMLSVYDSFLNITEIVDRLICDSSLEDQPYDYLLGASDEIRFYANKPQSFLTIITGTSLDLKLLDVYGSFRIDPDFENQYLLNFKFDFKNEKYLKAGKVLLKLAFGLTNSEMENPSSNELIIKNIHISKEQVYKIFVL
jgi:hypothetical protein